MTTEEFIAWVTDAAPGERIVYLRGSLGRHARFDARSIARTALALSGYRRAPGISNEAALWERGGPAKVDLVQRRHGPDDYEYIAVRRAQE